MEWKDIWQGVVAGLLGVIAIVASVAVTNSVLSAVLALAGTPLMWMAGVVIGWEASTAEYRDLYEELVGSEE